MNCRRFRSTCVFATLALTGISAVAEEPPDLWGVQKLVAYHQAHHDSMRVQDVYKLLFQANFGAGHLLTDTVVTRERLQEELSTLGMPNPGEPLVERISTDGEMIRVNLRPFKAMNRDEDTLVRCMVRSVRDPDTLSFVRQWNEFFAMVRYGVLEFPRAEAEVWNGRVVQEDFSPVHHSEEYLRVNNPAYRVVRQSVLVALYGNILTQTGH